MENTDNETFRYTYSAKEQAEIRDIRTKYTPPERSEDKLEQLRRLDAGVSTKATAAALAVGILGTLLLGAGMSLIMTEFSAVLGAYASLALPIGIVAGLVGIALVCLAYPVYGGVLKKQKEKVAPEILRLTDELLK